MILSIRQILTINSFEISTVIYQKSDTGKLDFICSTYSKAAFLLPLLQEMGGVTKYLSFLSITHSLCMKYVGP